ncbi:MAG TPA: EamA family transporter [Terriglobales bacterium]|nr:EamA family transporter [Terriglobales bacterium]
MTVFLMILVAVAMEVVGQLLYKSGINRMHGFQGSPFEILPLARFALDALRNWRVLLGIGVYCAQAAVWWGVLSRADLSYAFPLTSMSYVLLLVASRAFLHEHISLTRWMGATAVVFGVYLITRSAPLVR